MKSWIKLAVLGALAIGGTELYLHLRSRAAAPPPGKPAPAFTLADTNGKPISLESLRGRVVAVNFWATWCGPCREEIPDLAQVYTAHKDKCFELLGLAEESGERDEIVAAAAKLGVNYPVLLDDGGKVGDLFEIPAYPRTFLIDTGGRIRKVFEGAVDKAELESALAPLLAEAPASCPRA
jgi:cytochrome c biogenesis protein CcmG/thiol:disulfide interchange protein DsbE